MHDEQDLPVLNAVVRSGNESIIQSTRLGHQLLDELEAMRRASLAAVQRDAGPERPARELLREVSLPGLGDGSVVHLLAEDDVPALIHRAAAARRTHPARPADAGHDDGDEALDAHGNDRPDNERRALEALVDDIVDRHVAALREDLMQLLSRAHRP